MAALAWHQSFDEVFAVNVRAPLFIVQEGLKRLRDGGQIINISSGAARLAVIDTDVNAGRLRGKPKPMRPPWLRWAGSGSRKTRPTSWPSSPRTMRAG
ncbi:NAD(P)-dependent dehydrogenase (short-subunit alcohol dehydrogenase family) [Streptomyces griseochromogenes]|uniref:NAD(P)-dependent dehydrogenase (Short-subunit alcohol dehydrogenase family) n=1 Tax=Streptomyces griseochromogenes TaxID=68214 RepID=A0ABS4LR57_9ACTN|nr:NAD(P)-dependent dehydrogenase (short-subunit alcohol dehydrogenase family) [Streptomyces griseochromogenes]